MSLSLRNGMEHNILTLSLICFRYVVMDTVDYYTDIVSDLFLVCVSSYPLSIPRKYLKIYP